MVSKVLQRVDEVVFGGIVLLTVANTRLRRAAERISLDSVTRDSRMECSRDDLDEELVRVIGFTRRIESKAMITAVVGTLLSLSAVFCLVSDPPTELSWVVSIPLVLGVLYLFLGVLLSVRSYWPFATYIPSVGDNPPMLEERESKRVLLFCILRNQSAQVIRNNFLVASMLCLRNGVLLFVVWVLVRAGLWWRV